MAKLQVPQDRRGSRDYKHEPVGDASAELAIDQVSITFNATKDRSS